MAKMRMELSTSLEYVLFGIENGRIDAAIDFLNDLISQAKAHEKERDEKKGDAPCEGEGDDV